MSGNVDKIFKDVRSERLEDGRKITYYKFGDVADAVSKADSESFYQRDCGKCVSPDESSVSSD